MHHSINKLSSILLTSLLSLSLLTTFLPILPVKAAVLPSNNGIWTQTDWSGGSGQASWSDTTKFLSETHTDTSIPQQISTKLTKTFAEAMGGTGSDIIKSIQQTSDGGYIAGGYATFYGAGNYDAWILKLDSTGAVTWQKTYGGTGTDEIYSIQQTSDGGYVAAGVTASYGAGGNDAWILKLDSTGAVTWQKTYGGTGWDWLYSIQQTSDGGYIAVGVTTSYVDTINGDAWILKLDSTGAVTWQKTYGGTGTDQIYSIQQTSDGGYVAAGVTASYGAGGNDAWILKLDSTGALTWQKTYGGIGADSLNSIQQTSDGGYIAGGITSSYVDTINGDAWILKLDSTGAVTWQKTYGGTGTDQIYSIQQTSDGGYVAAGVTASYGAGGNDAWILKLDSTGAVTWQKTYGGTGWDWLYSIQQTSDGGYIAAGYTTSYGAGSYDAWILKLDSTGSFNSPAISGLNIQNSTAIPADSTATPADSTATPADSTATPADSTATTADPAATVTTLSSYLPYPSSSTLTSSTYSSNAPYTVWGPLSYNATTPQNTSVSFQVSTDNGTTWQSVKNSTTQTFGPSPTLTYKVTLQNTDGLSTPTLTSVSIPYTTIPGATSSGGGSGISSSLPTPTPSLSPTPSASTPSPTPSSSITPSLQPTSLPSLPPSPSPLPTPSPTPSPTLSLPSTSLLPQSCSFTKNLYLGITDPQVHCLQIFLNTNGYTLSLQGFGSLHNETNYFGPLTQAALKRFQQAHQINPALGYFGPITRGFILSLTK